VNILHLSDTTLSGAPDRLSKLLTKHSSGKINSRHLVWHRVIFNRVFNVDICSSELSKKEIEAHFKWADVIHYHNRYSRQMIFTQHGLKPPKKPSLIQIHSPRESEDFSQELDSKIPLAVIAQYHTRQWPELKFVVPNVVDITDPMHSPIEKPLRNIPTVSYAPSNIICKGWDNKSYMTVNPAMKRFMFDRMALYKRIVSLPHATCLELKQDSNIGIDEVSTGSYHMSSLEYLSMGVACVGKLDDLCQASIKQVTGAESLPWIMSSEGSFVSDMRRVLMSKEYYQIGIDSRKWMEKYWNPDFLVKYFTEVYNQL
jgi:hypothetical protein